MNKHTFNRRRFLGLAAAAPAGLGILGASHKAAAAGTQGGGHVVIVGGGFGGATAAKYIRKFDAGIKVTLIEPGKTYVTCPGSNWVLAGMRELSSLTQRYDRLGKDWGVEVIHDTVTDIDAIGKSVKLEGGSTLSYDRLIVSPGIALQDNVEGYDASVYDKVPHAWKAGPQTTLLRDQIVAMEDGGTIIIACPPNPFRCPPGPPERISMIAAYLKQNKPRSKILALDAKDSFSKKGLFEQGWEALYGYGTENSMIEWVPAAEGGRVLRLDVADMSVIAGDFEEKHVGQVINIIPAQKAGIIAQKAGLTDDSGWCPVNPATSESTFHPYIHVIGDASIQGAMPKSGYAANSQAKVCAAHIVAMLREQEAVSPSWVNTCYSLVGEDYGISVAAVYEIRDDRIAEVEGAGGVSDINDLSIRPAEATFARAWYDSITRDTWG
ncbi:MAG: FAD-dependent oxidoreductase [Thiothrix sp.]|nr:FAD-dependent oxidoreductase [Thiothrix sp.]HPE58769.1 FCSD flavin-binding domain-containing protein [Thiolinea sp.]